MTQGRSRVEAQRHRADRGKKKSGSEDDMGENGWRRSRVGYKTRATDKELPLPVWVPMVP